jgi:hypothetical protein
MDENNMQMPHCFVAPILGVLRSMEFNLLVGSSRRTSSQHSQASTTLQYANKVATSTCVQIAESGQHVISTRLTRGACNVPTLSGRIHFQAGPPSPLLIRPRAGSLILVTVAEPSHARRLTTNKPSTGPSRHGVERRCGVHRNTCDVCLGPQFERVDFTHGPMASLPATG